MNATTTPARRQRKPARSCKIAHVGDATILLIRRCFPRRADVLDTYTVVCEGGRQQALDVARSVPPESRPPVSQRAKKAARRLLEDVSGSR